MTKQFHEPDYIARYLQGALSPEQESEFECYFMDNPELLDALELDTTLRENLRAGFSAQSLTETFSLRHFGWSFALTVACLALVALPFVWTHSGKDDGVGMGPDDIPATTGQGVSRNTSVTAPLFIAVGSTRSVERQEVALGSQSHILVSLDITPWLELKPLNVQMKARNVVRRFTARDDVSSVPLFGEEIPKRHSLRTNDSVSFVVVTNGLLDDDGEGTLELTVSDASGILFSHDILLRRETE